MFGDFFFYSRPSIKNTQLQRFGSFLAAVAAVSLRPVLSAHLASQEPCPQTCPCPRSVRNCVRSERTPEKWPKATG